MNGRWVKPEASKTAPSIPLLNVMNNTPSLLAPVVRIRSNQQQQPIRTEVRVGRWLERCLSRNVLMTRLSILSTRKSRLLRFNDWRPRGRQE